MIPAVREKMRFAAIKTMDVWDFAQLTFNLGTIKVENEGRGM